MGRLPIFEIGAVDLLTFSSRKNAPPRAFPLHVRRLEDSVDGNLSSGLSADSLDSAKSVPPEYPVTIHVMRSVPAFFIVENGVWQRPGSETPMNEVAFGGKIVNSICIRHEKFPFVPPSNILSFVFPLFQFLSWRYVPREQGKAPVEKAVSLTTALRGVPNWNQAAIMAFLHQCVFHIFMPAESI